jgi:hypothetical protein
MAGEDYNKISLILGKRGTGKTDYLKGNPKHNLRGFIPLYLKRGMKVLIVDTIDHPSYRDIPIIKKEQLAGWKKGVYRIFCRASEMPELCNLINETLWNTLVVFEDAHKHQDVRIDKSVMDLMSDSKQKNVDIIFMYHLFAKAPKDLYRYVDFIEVFKTKDHPSVREADMVGYYDAMLSAWNEVMKHPSLYHHKLVNTDL